MEDFVTLEIAQKLKEKDFKEECLCYYVGDDLAYNIESHVVNYQLRFCHNKYDNIWHRDNVDAPTIAQVLKWLRNEKEIYCLPHFEQGVDLWFFYVSKPQMGCEFPEYMSESIYNTYEDTALAGIKYMIDNLI